MKGYTVRVALIPTDQIRIPSIQRDLSQTLVKRLALSIEKVGFVEPILVVEEDLGFEVINGQHRLEAAKSLGIEEVPAVIVPKELKDFVIALNVEKAPNLKDKAHQAYEIFSKHLQESPDMREEELADKVEEPYYVTVGFVIEELQDKKFPGYAFEKVLKKVDDFLGYPLKDAREERLKRAQVLEEVKEVLNERYAQLGLTNALQKETIVTKAFQNLYGKRVRKVEDDFYTFFERLKSAIEKVEVSPEEEVESF